MTGSELVELVVSDLRRLYVHSDPAVDLAIEDLRNGSGASEIQMALNIRNVLATHAIDPFGTYDPESIEAGLVDSYMKNLRRVREARTCLVPAK